MAIVNDFIGLFNDKNPPADGSESDNLIRTSGVGVFNGTVWDGGGGENKVRVTVDECPDEVKLTYTPDNGIFLTELSPQVFGNTTGVLDKAGLTPIVGHSAVIAYVTLRTDIAASSVRFGLHNNGSLEETFLYGSLAQWVQGTDIVFIARKLAETIEVEIQINDAFAASHSFDVVPATIGNKVAFTQGAQDFEITKFDWENIGAPDGAAQMSRMVPLLRSRKRFDRVLKRRR